MGCDIHPFIEVRDKQTGLWVMLERPDSHRNYAWFGVIAGVRSYEAPKISEPKGIPDDSSIVCARMLDDNQDLHSHSYLTLAELSEAWRRYMDYVEQEGRDEVEILASNVLANKPKYYERIGKDADGEYNWPPIMEQIRWYGEIDLDLNIALDTDGWYDDMRYVFAFDN